MITKAVQSFLSNQSTITAIVSTRIYPHHISGKPNPTYPALTHQLKGNNHQDILSGGAGYSIARIAIDCWATHPGTIETLAEAVRLKMQGYSGLMGATQVDRANLVNEFDMDEPPKDGSNQWLYRRVMEFSLRYQEAVPS